jgi:hypothetical protein
LFQKAQAWFGNDLVRSIKMGDRFHVLLERHSPQTATFPAPTIEPAGGKDHHAKRVDDNLQDGPNLFGFWWTSRNEVIYRNYLIQRFDCVIEGRRWARLPQFE